MINCPLDQDILSGRQDYKASKYTNDGAELGINPGRPLKIPTLICSKL